MKHGMDKETATRMARGLINEADSRIEMGNPEGAVWRLLDAVGILEEVYPHPDPTGRGYKVINTVLQAVE